MEDSPMSKRKPVLTLRVSADGFRMIQAQAKPRIVGWFAKALGK
jgi:hypothetical protein